MRFYVFSTTIQKTGTEHTDSYRLLFKQNFCAEFFLPFFSSTLTPVSQMSPVTHSELLALNTSYIISFAS